MSVVVWRDAKYRSRWWARLHDENGRCVWLSYGYRSPMKAEKAAEEVQDELQRNG